MQKNARPPEGKPSATRHAHFSPILTLDEARDIVVWRSSYEKLPTILGLEMRMHERDWLVLLGESWSCCDNIGAFADELRGSALGRATAPVDELMTEDARAAYDKLPDEIVVYRGCYATNRNGLSWSLDRGVAVRFPLLWRYQQEGQPLLVKGIAKKSDVLALILDRDEQEVILLNRPRHVSTVRLRRPSTEVA